MSRTRILYIDDSRFDRELVRHALTDEDLGFDLIEASSYAELKEHLTRYTFDVVLSDFNIAGFEGLDVITLVRQQDPSIPVIIVTGTGSEKVAVEAMQRGASDYVIKTTQHIQRLPHTIQKAIEKTQLTRTKKKAQAELLYQANLLQFVSDAIISTDNEQRVESWNRAAEKIYGWTAEEVMGQPIESIVQTEFDSIEGLSDDDESGQGIWRGEVVQRRRDGSRVPIMTSVSPILGEDGQQVGWVTVNRDLSGRKLAEAQYRKMFESVQDAIFVVGHDTVIRDTNPAAARLFGYVHDAMQGRPLGDFVPEGDADVLEEAFAILGNDSPYVTESILQRADGTLFDAEVRFFPVNYYGETYVLGMIRDITARKELEKELVEVSSREQQRIGQDLHDGLGQELTAVSFRLALLEEAMSERGHPEADTLNELGDMVRQAQRQARSLAHGLNPVNLDEQSFSEVLGELVDRVATAFDVACVYDCPVPIPLRDANIALHVYRILQEALTNAIRHGNANRIMVCLTWEGEQTTLEVRDNGTGLAPSETRTDGIGLRTMAYRARMINGSFQIENHPDGGTLMTCSFKIKQNAYA